MCVLGATWGSFENEINITSIQIDFSNNKVQHSIANMNILNSELNHVTTYPS